MATYEHNALMQYIDETGNMHINYPATKAENVMMGNSNAQTEITARAKTSDILYTLEEISACTDFTNKISGAEAVNKVNSNLANKGKYYELGKFSSTGSKALSDNALNYEELVVYGNVSKGNENYVIDTMRIQSASINVNQYFIVALNDGTNRKGQFMFSTNGDNIIVDTLDNVNFLTVYGITKKS